jgi:hypothetical protein
MLNYFLLSYSKLLYFKVFLVIIGYFTLGFIHSWGSKKGKMIIGLLWGYFL